MNTNFMDCFIEKLPIEYSFLIHLFIYHQQNKIWSEGHNETDILLVELVKQFSYGSMTIPISEDLQVLPALYLNMRGHGIAC